MARAWKCSSCGIRRLDKWTDRTIGDTGRCPGCGGFHNIVATSADLPGAEVVPVDEGEVVSLCDVTASSLKRISGGFPSIDKILGTDKVENVSGIAADAGHAIQIYGSPGSGKSTLILQLCREYAKQRHEVLYIAGEETLEQIKARANRIGKFNQRMRIVRVNDLDSVLDKMEEYQPKICVIDSINTITVDEYMTGSISAVGIAAREIVALGKRENIGLFIVSQLTKSNDFSGPKVVEHSVDTTLYMSGRKGDKFRLLSCETKNRNGLTPGYAHLFMTDAGLVEVDAPGERTVTEEEPIAAIPIEG